MKVRKWESEQVGKGAAKRSYLTFSLSHFLPCRLPA